MNSLVSRLPKSIDYRLLNDRLPTIANIILILACSYSLSQLTWLFISVDQASIQAPIDHSRSTPSSLPNQRQRRIQQIPQSHLFGIYESQSTAAPVQTDAPDTRLNLVLKGLLAATPMTNASAIIAMGKAGKEDIYGIGDRVSSATVKEIYADRVILEHKGRFETLRLPKEFSDGGRMIRTIKRAPPVSQNLDSPGSILADIRSKILKNPTSFGDYAIPLPYNENGKLRGYKLQPQGGRALFDKIGLDPNDVIVELNGVKLNNPNRSLKALRKLQNAKSMDITVLRNGAEIPLHFEIP